MTSQVAFSWANGKRYQPTMDPSIGGLIRRATGGCHRLQGRIEDVWCGPSRFVRRLTMIERTTFSGGVFAPLLQGGSSGWGRGSREGRDASTCRICRPPKISRP